MRYFPLYRGLTVNEIDYKIMRMSFELWADKHTTLTLGSIRRMREKDCYAQATINTYWTAYKAGYIQNCPYSYTFKELLRDVQAILKYTLTSLREKLCR